MRGDEYIPGQLVAGFQGEDRQHPAVLMPPNISPNALNCDYRDGTIRKRLGMRRLLDTPLTSGGVRLVNGYTTQSARAYVEVASTLLWSGLTGGFALSFSFALKNHDDTVLQTILETNAGTLTVKFDDTLECSFTTSGAPITLTSSNTYAGGGTEMTTVHCMIVYMPGSPNDYRLYDVMHTSTDATESAQTTTTADTFTFPGAGYFAKFGGALTVDTEEMILSEIRVWDLNGMDSTALNAFIARWTTDKFFARGLNSTEAALSELEAYWPMTGSTKPYSVVSSSHYLTITQGAATVSETYTRLSGWCHGLVNAVYNKSNSIRIIKRIAKDLLDVLGARDEFLIGTDSQLYICIPYLDEYSSHAVPTMRTVGSFYGGTPIEAESWRHPWDCAILNNELVVTRKSSENALSNPARFITANIGETYSHKLVPAAPVVSATTLTASAAGTGLGAGVYSYKFLYYSSAKLHVGPSSAIKTVTTGAGDQVAITVIKKGGGDSNTEYDTVRILRTVVDGAVYYFLDDTTTDTYTDTTDDATLLLNDSEDTLGYVYTGDVEDGRIAFTHLGHIFLGNTKSDSSSIFWAEAGTNYKFYAFNKLDVFPFDGDELTAAISDNNALLLTKNNSMYVARGTAPSELGVFKFFDGAGCISHRTVASGVKGYYVLGTDGVYLIPRPIGSGTPINISQATHRDEFTSLDANLWTEACAAYYPATSEYWVTFTKDDGSVVTMIYNELSGGWTKWDLDIEAYYVINPSMRNNISGEPATGGSGERLFGGYRGNLVELLRDNTDGSAFHYNATPITPTVSGTCTGGGDYYFEDSGEDWPDYRTNATGDAALNKSFPFGGMAGLKVRITYAADGSTEEREIYFNTATKCWVDTAWGTNPQAGDTYEIAYINWYWESSPFPPDGDPAREVRGLTVHTWFRKDGNSNAVDFLYEFDDADTQTIELSSGVRHEERKLRARGEELTIRYENDAPDEPVEIEAFRIGLAEAEKQ